MHAASSIFDLTGNIRFKHGRLSAITSYLQCYVIHTRGREARQIVARDVG